MDVGHPSCEIKIWYFEALQSLYQPIQYISILNEEWGVASPPEHPISESHVPSLWKEQLLASHRLRLLCLERARWIVVKLRWFCHSENCSDQKGIQLCLKRQKLARYLKMANSEISVGTWPDNLLYWGTICICFFLIHFPMLQIRARARASPASARIRSQTSQLVLLALPLAMLHRTETPRLRGLVTDVLNDEWWMIWNITGCHWMSRFFSSTWVDSSMGIWRLVLFFLNCLRLMIEPFVGSTIAILSNLTAWKPDWS